MIRVLLTLAAAAALAQPVVKIAPVPSEKTQLKAVAGSYAHVLAAAQGMKMERVKSAEASGLGQVRYEVFSAPSTGYGYALLTDGAKVFQLHSSRSIQAFKAASAGRDAMNVAKGSIPYELAALRGEPAAASAAVYQGDRAGVDAAMKRCAEAHVSKWSGKPTVIAFARQGLVLQCWSGGSQAAPVLDFSWSVPETYRYLYSREPPSAK